MARITVSLPKSIVEDLDFISSRLRCSRSALLAIALGESAAALRQICEMLPPPGQDVSEGDARRFRGDSARVLQELISGLQIDGGQDDLFPGE